MLLDVAGAIAAQWRTDIDMLDAFDGRIFADMIPAGVDGVPCVVVRNNGAQHPFAGVQTWDSVSVLVDVLGDPAEIPTLLALAGNVRARLEGLSGTTLPGVLVDIVVQSVEPTNLVFGYDPTFTPALPRWVLATSLVVRSNEKE